MESLYHAALEVSGEERAALLAKSDPEIRRAVEALLAHEGSGEVVLDRPAWEQTNSSLDSVRTQFLPGEQLGSYRVEGKLGVGGMGEVYRARDTKLEREVAIKVLPASVAQDPERRARFEREGKVLASLNHPNIAQIYGVEEGALVMELVEGEILRGPLPIDTALNYARQIADALEAAHDKGIIHRDLKPANVMITPRGVVKVLDFGLAAVSQPAESSSVAGSPTLTHQTTQPGMIMGTAPYMSPEQAAGKPVDKRADIWSFGVVLWEMLTGHRLFAGETPSHTMAAVLQGPIDFSKLPQTTPPSVRELMQRCLDRDVNTRLRDIGEARFQIQRYLANPNSSSAGDRAETPQLVSGTPIAALEIATQRPSARKYWVMAVAVLLVAMAAGYWYWRTTASPAQIESIAVIPFASVGGNADSDYLSDGLTESLIASLAHLPQLKVKSRNSVFRYKGKEVDLQKVGTELSVAALLTGRVVQRGDTIQVRADLTNVRDNTEIWGEQYERKTSDILSLQQQIAGDIARELRSKLSGAERQQATRQGTQNPEAYQLYVKGRYYWNKRNSADLKTAISYFNQAIDKDPGYALAYSGMADAYGVLTNYGSDPNDVTPKSSTAAERALELDPTLARPHAILGYNKMLYDWDFSGGEAEFRRALELDPSDASAHQWFSETLSYMGGRVQESIDEGNQARRLDALSPIIGFQQAQAYAIARKFDKAIELYKKVIADNPAFGIAHWGLGRVYWAERKYPQAIQEFEIDAQLAGYKNDAEAAAMDAGFRSGGWPGALRKAIDVSLAQAKTGKNVSSFHVAELYADLGDKDHAFQWLNTAYERHGHLLYGLRTAFAFDSLRSDPRYAELVRKIGLPQ
jgi:serine/threonine protein kinase/tetratricopeptide (TPR) repeat protein